MIQYNGTYWFENGLIMSNYNITTEFNKSPKLNENLQCQWWKMRHKKIRAHAELENAKSCTGMVGLTRQKIVMLVGWL